MSDSFSIKASASSLIKDIEMKYSDAKYSSSCMFSNGSTRRFESFLRENTLFSFFKQIEVAEEILGLPQGSLVSAIEEQLATVSWSMKDEEDRLADNWNGYVHPQGWPVVWITTDFQELAMEILLNILDKIVVDHSVSDRQVDLLWRTIQPADPNYVLRDLISRPLDIEPLVVSNKDIWLDELRKYKTLEVGATKSCEENWITVFETREMTHEEDYNVPFKQRLSIRGSLIPIDLYGSSEKIDDLDIFFEKFLPHQAMTTTMGQAQAKISARASGNLQIFDEYIPFLSIHQNPVTIFGYLDICTLSSII